LFVYRIVEREKRRSILSATSRVAVDLETTAVWCEAGEVGMARAARLAGLPGVARQGARRRRELDNKNGSKKQGRQAD
jgi:hypothetical protein